MAGAVGSGKVALTTTSPAGVLRNDTIENAVAWSEAPSVLLSSYTLNQEIIWAGDTVQIDLKFEDLVGNDITGADVTVWLNSSQLDAVDMGSGVFRVTLTGEWTGTNLGTFDLRIDASKAGFDTLSLILELFILIRPFPWLTIGIFGGGVIALVGGWIYVKKKRGDDMPWQRDKTPRDQKRTKEDRKKREKEDGKADVREYFGV